MVFMKEKRKISKFLSELGFMLTSIIGEVGARLAYSIQKPNIVLIIPARNEEKNIKKVIQAGKKSKYVSEILVVDSFSNDRTAEIAKKAGVRVVRQNPDKKGKGGAIYTGIQEAVGNILVFMDADISNINPKMIDALIKPIIRGKADYTKAKFKRKLGRVSSLTAGPLLELFFPEIKFKQPLSGIFASRADLLKKIEIEEGWGVDVGIIIDVVMKDYKVKEVSIGYVEHDTKPLEQLVPMAEQVAATVMKKAHQYGRIGVKMKALILAAGRGKRLRPFTDKVPKPLIKINDVPIMEIMLLQLKKLGITDIVVTIGYKGGMIKKHFGKEWNGLNIEYVENKQWDNDVGNLSILVAKEKINQRFIMLLGDNVLNYEILERVVKEGGDFVFCVDRNEQLLFRRKEGIKALVENGRIKDIGIDLKGNAILTGVAVCNPKFFEIVDEALKEGAINRPDVIKWMCDKNIEVKACDITGCFWMDIDTRDDIRRVEEIMGGKV